jgi:hypothetical protein
MKAITQVTFSVCIAAAPELTLVLLASLLSYFRYYLDPEFAHNHDWEVPY